jgi:LysR family transcriptional activator of mexEF-oprN operon
MIDDITPLNAKSLDLNLLVTFEALMRTRSVTGAAKALGVGQPAMSAALKRLRALLGDEIFVRGRHGLTPTTRAMELEPVVTRALSDLRNALFVQRPFEPSAEARAFHIGTSDYIAAGLAPPLLQAIERDAPGVALVFHHTRKDHVPAALEAGVIDVALGYFPELYGPLKVRRLYTDELVCLFDPEACGVAPPLSLADYVRLPHLLMSTRGETSGVVDEALNAEGRSRRVRAAMPYFLSLPFCLYGLKAVACAPRRMAELCANATRLAVSPVPAPMPALEVSMAWTARADRDPGLVWLRGLIASVAAQV